MKICPKCYSKFADDLFFCLNDGVTLIAENDFDKETTLSFSETPTIENRNLQTANENRQYIPPTYPNYSKQGTNPMAVVGIVLGGFLLIVGVLATGTMYLTRRISEIPNPTPRTTPYKTPYSTPTPEEKVELKIEQVGKVKRSFGQQFLKFMVTNPSEKIVFVPNISFTLYQGDVKVGTARGETKLKYLKPGQTIPIWADLFGNEKFTDAKPETSIIAKVAGETNFPKMTLSDTKMKVSKGTSSFNNYVYTENWYEVTGIAENVNSKNVNSNNVSGNIVVIFYDANSNIVGMASTSISNLKQGEKQKFEVGAGETSELFGKPNKFEVIVTDGRMF